MQLLTLHKVLMACSLCAASTFAAYGFYQASTAGSVGYGVAGAFAAGVAVGVGAYLRYFAAKARRLHASSRVSR